MLTGTFTTQSLPAGQQFEGWCGWYDRVFETTTSVPCTGGFVASNSNWTVGGFTISRVCSPPASVARTRPFIRRNPVDHWAVTLSEHSTSKVEARSVRLDVRPGVPFILSFGEELRISRVRQDKRVQLLLSRDSFGDVAQLLDAAAALALDTPGGRLLADYVLLLEKYLPGLTAEEALRVKGAVQAMIEACLAPSPDRLAKAGGQINVTLMERVRRAVSRNLRSPSLGPAELCREAATSRSQLYRLLEREGGVAHYIQRCRLSESYTLLADASNDAPIGKIAEMLCFTDPSSFSRAFRREFGITPGEVRTASQCGLHPAVPVPVATGEGEVRTFADCLRAF